MTRAQTCGSDPYVAVRVGEAATPGPAAGGAPCSAACNTAAIVVIQKLEAQLDDVHLVPSGLRDAAIDILTEAIDEVREGDAQAYDAHLVSAGKKWLTKLCTWCPGFDSLHPADQRRRTDAYLRGGWHAVTALIVRLAAQGAIQLGTCEHTAAEHADDTRDEPIEHEESLGQEPPPDDLFAGPPSEAPPEGYFDELDA